MSRAAARRFLLTLVELGYVGSLNDRFFLRVPTLELGFAFLSSLHVQDIVQPFIDDVSAQTGETSSVAILSGTEITFLARASTKRFVSVKVGIGSKLTAFSTSLGRVLLAGLPSAKMAQLLQSARIEAFTSRTITSPLALAKEIEVVREQGWAMIQGEIDPAVESMATSILDGQGSVVAAVNISTYAGRLDEPGVREAYLSVLRNAARGIGAAVRASPAFALQIQQP